MRSAGHRSPALATLSAMLAFPWCCIESALLSTVGISAAGLGWLAGPQHLWIFLALSSSAVTWSLYLTVVKRQGSPAYRGLSLAFVLVAVGIWTWRLYL